MRVKLHYYLHSVQLLFKRWVVLQGNIYNLEGYSKFQLHYLQALILIEISVYVKRLIHKEDTLPASKYVDSIKRTVS